ncbi:hypothetical protein A0H81_02933 [Grifola frondosa]|uniref:Uncharacterized protein n=1 Tax=Grifola frondosa TaxID=5627 RepID=A0A1C7MHI6_GRIFR|nr:hypothetical protein A0H81_02933 [Grifola frondosa]
MHTWNKPKSHPRILWFFKRDYTQCGATSVSRYFNVQACFQVKTYIVQYFGQVQTAAMYRERPSFNRLLAAVTYALRYSGAKTFERAKGVVSIVKIGISRPVHPIYTTRLNGRSGEGKMERCQHAGKCNEAKLKLHECGANWRVEKCCALYTHIT